MERMDALAASLGVAVERAETGKRYRGPGTSYIGVYRSNRGFELALRPLRDSGYGDVANAITEELVRWLGRPLQGAGDYPYFRCAHVLADWERLRQRVIEPFLTAGR